MNSKTKKIYLMLGGTFFPASIAVTLTALISRESVTYKDTKYLIAFGIGAAIGGYFSAKMLQEEV